MLTYQCDKGESAAEVLHSPLKRNKKAREDRQVLSENEFHVKNIDCLIGLTELSDVCVDLVVTDPPYNIGSHMKSRGSGIHRLRENHFSTCDWDNICEAEWLYNMDKMATELFRVVKNGGAVVVFMSIIKVGSIKDIFEKAGFYYKTTGIWHKTNPMPRNMNLSFINSTESWVYFTKGKPSGKFNNDKKAIHDFFETGLTPASEKKHGKHPTQKPLKLIESLIKLLSDEGDVILDPFLGSGTTAVAAKKLNRRFFGFELESEYITIAEKRLKDI